MGKYKIDIQPLNASFLLINWPQRIDEDISKELLAFERLLKENLKIGFIECNPSYASLCIQYDGSIIEYTVFSKKIFELYNAFDSTSNTEVKNWRVPVCYDAIFAPDMAALCLAKNCSREQIIAWHTGPDYRIYFRGFLPGFLYLGGLDEKLVHPRKEKPREKVSMGAVGIAGNQTGIYPINSPGGWQLIGRTPVQLNTADSLPASKYKPGDYIKFYAIDQSEFDAMANSEKDFQRPENPNARTKDFGQIEFLTPGLFTSLQDFGRQGYRRWGIPHGGVMDQAAAARANFLLHKPREAPVLEITNYGPKILFHQPAKLALAGGQIELKLNGQLLLQPNVINVKKGDVLHFGKVTQGSRVYLAISGEFFQDDIFGSISKVAGLQKSLRFEKGNVLKYYQNAQGSIFNAKIKVPNISTSNIIDAMSGPEFSLLTKAQQESIFKNKFSISSTSTRMAFTLESTSQEILSHDISLLTGPVVPGIVQLTPDGKLIVLMRDAQTTGGYPRVLVLTEKGLNDLAQQRVGQLFKFNLVQGC